LEKTEDYDKLINNVTYIQYVKNFDAEIASQHTKISELFTEYLLEIKFYRKFSEIICHQKFTENFLSKNFKLINLTKSNKIIEKIIVNQTLSSYFIENFILVNFQNTFDDLIIKHQTSLNDRLIEKYKINKNPCLLNHDISFKSKIELIKNNNIKGNHMPYIIYSKFDVRLIEYINEFNYSNLIVTLVELKISKLNIDYLYELINKPKFSEYLNQTKFKAIDSIHDDNTKKILNNEEGYLILFIKYQNDIPDKIFIKISGLFDKKYVISIIKNNKNLYINEKIGKLFKINVSLQCKLFGIKKLCDCKFKFNF
jgi:hypothetical protein